MKLLITGAWRYTEQQRAQIEKMGHETIFLQNENDALPIPYEAVEGVIGNGLFLHHPIEKFTALKYIQLTSAGFDRVPMDYVRSHGIEIHNARGVYSIPMAEFALCGVLRLYKQSAFFRKNQQAHCWEKHRGLLELSGKRVCIVGCGSVGTECAKRFAAFDCRVTGVDIAPYVSPFYELILPLEALDQGLREADILVLTLPLTEKTRYLMNEERFATMKPGAVLVNIARGAVVDTAALTAALESRLGGAVLDVFEEEPLSAASPLWDMENVLITPHNSFVGDHNTDRLWSVIRKNLQNAEEKHSDPCQ